MKSAGCWILVTGCWIVLAVSAGAPFRAGVNEGELMVPICWLLDTELNHDQ